MTGRVVCTGTGVICALGDSTASFWDACLAGRSRVEPIPQHWHRYTDFRSTLWSPLPPLDHERLGINRVERLQHDPVSLLSAVATREALEQAGFDLEQVDARLNTWRVRDTDSTRIGVYLGTGIGGANSFLDNQSHQVLSRARAELEGIARELDADSGIRQRIDGVLSAMRHRARVNPFVVSMLMPNAVSAWPGIRFSLHGPNHTVALACASGTAAIGTALAALRAGEVDVAIAGGAEYLDDPHGSIFRGFDLARALVRECDDPATANRPFDRDRSGFLFSQGGAAALVLERLDHARRRGARPLAEVAGYGLTFDAYSMMHIAPDGAQIERAMRTALADAGLQPGDVDYVNAHGTGTANNDEVEAGVIGRVLGERVAVNATKSLLGHTIGASGAIEAVVTVQSLLSQRTHGCLNLDHPVAPINLLREAGPVAMEAALTQSFGFGGHNAALVLRRWNAPLHE